LSQNGLIQNGLSQNGLSQNGLSNMAHQFKKIVILLANKSAFEGAESPYHVLE
jgi:hypothetical protein